MKDFLVYHNPDAMGVDVRKVNAFAIVTNKPVTDNVIGSRVWLLTASGKPRTFLLRSYFIVDQVDSNVDGFQTRLSGTTGKVFEPMIELNHEHWFDALKKSQGNFAFGLQRIQNERFIGGLEKLANAQ
jgi:hypothetical protein